MRLLPYFQETRRNGATVGARPGSNDCTTCREQLPVTIRQDRGCVYEERTDALQRAYVLRPPLPWRTSAPFVNAKGEEVPAGSVAPPSVCPLYLGRVAEASDVLDALPHFRRGTLRSWLGREPDPPLLEALEEYEAGQLEWTHDPNRPKERA